MKWYLHFLIVADKLLTCQKACDANANLVTGSAYGHCCYGVIGLKININTSVYGNIINQSIPIVYPGIENIYKKTFL